LGDLGCCGVQVVLHGEKMSGSDGMVFDANGRLFFGVFDYVRCVCGCIAVWLCGCVAVWLCGCGCVVFAFCSCVCVCQTGLIALHAWLDRLAWRCGTQQHRSARRKCLSTTPLACSGWTRLRLAVMTRLCSQPTGCSSISMSVVVGRIVVLLQVAGAATYASMNDTRAVHHGFCRRARR